MGPGPRVRKWHALATLNKPESYFLGTIFRWARSASLREVHRRTDGQGAVRRWAGCSGVSTTPRVDPRDGYTAVSANSRNLISGGGANSGVPITAGPRAVRAHLGLDPSVGYPIIPFFKN